MKIGDEVRCEINDQRRGMVSYGFIIGVPKIAPDCVVVSTPQITGMPINKVWCQETGIYDYETAMWCRQRYEKLAPDYLMKEGA
jgi:hypothetical protein